MIVYCIIISFIIVPENVVLADEKQKLFIEISCKPLFGFIHLLTRIIMINS